MLCDLRYAIAAVLLLPVISFEAYAQQPRNLVADVDGWRVYQHEGAEGAPSRSCSVVHFEDHITALRIERVKDGYIFGLNGLSRDQQGAEYPLKFWFDGDRSNELSGDAAFVRDASFADDDWLSFFQTVDQAPSAVARISKSSLLSFAFQMPGNRTGNDEVTVSFDLTGSAAALSALEDCYHAAREGVTSDVRQPVAADEPVKDLSCPDDGPRLPRSGICQWRGVNYLNIVEGVQPALYEGCEWRLNETPFPGGDYLLYLAAFCDGRLSELEMSGGAHSGDLTLVVSALEGQDTSRKWATLIAVDPEKPEDSILKLSLNGLEGNEAAGCRIMNVGGEGYPSDALSIDDKTREEAKALAQDGPLDPTCGPFGSPGDANAYWRVLDEIAIYIDLGQDAYSDIDPRSVTLIRAADLPN